MPNFTVLKSSADLKRYFSPSGRDCWVEDGWARAFFGSKLTEPLGLGAFDEQTFSTSAMGSCPAAERSGTPKATSSLRARRRTSGADTTLWWTGQRIWGLVGLDDRIIPDVLERVARGVAALVEQDAMTRVRIEKQDKDRPTGNTVYTAVLHTTSRPVGDKVDVLPHLHMLIHNVPWDPFEHRYKALQLQPFTANGAKIDRPYGTTFLNARLGPYM